MATDWRHCRNPLGLKVLNGRCRLFIKYYKTMTGAGLVELSGDRVDLRLPYACGPTLPPPRQAPQERWPATGSGPVAHRGELPTADRHTTQRIMYGNGRQNKLTLFTTNLFQKGSKPCTAMTVGRNYFFIAHFLRFNFGHNGFISYICNDDAAPKAARQHARR